jgi:predicted thioredoxin/glutaredoxin
MICIDLLKICMFFTQFRKRKRGLAKAKASGVKSVPAVAINGKLVSTNGIDIDVLKTAGLSLC